MKKTLINEVRKFQKTAGILKEGADVGSMGEAFAEALESIEIEGQSLEQYIKAMNPEDQQRAKQYLSQYLAGFLADATEVY